MTPVFAQLHVGIGINIGPPAPVKEKIVVVKPYPNAVWIPGYYKWRPKHHSYVWVKGHWDRPPHAHGVGARALGTKEQRVGVLPRTLGKREITTQVDFCLDVLLFHFVLLKILRRCKLLV